VSRPRSVTGKILAAATLFFVVYSPSSLANTGKFGNHALLKGRHAHVGVRPNGAFGTSNTFPAASTDATDIAAVSNDNVAGCLGFVVDRNSLDFGAGAQVDGDYFCPGTPFEGWALSVGGVDHRNNDSTNNCAGSIAVANFNVLVANRHAAEWNSTGACLGLNVRQVYSLADDGQSLRMQVTLTNNSGGDLNAVRYARIVDPDNQTGAAGGGPISNSTNTIDGQGVNARVRSGFPSGAVLALISTDARAKAGRLTAGLGTTSTADDLIDQQNNFTQTGSATADAGIGLGIDVGTLVNGTSTTFTIEYALTADAAGVSQASPVPLMSPPLLLLFASLLGGLGLVYQRKRAT
jgi:hypothetical protein